MWSVCVREEIFDTLSGGVRPDRDKILMRWNVVLVVWHEHVLKKEIITSSGVSDIISDRAAISRRLWKTTSGIFQEIWRGANSGCQSSSGSQSRDSRWTASGCQGWLINLTKLETKQKADSKPVLKIIAKVFQKWFSYIVFPYISRED